MDLILCELWDGFRHLQCAVLCPLVHGSARRSIALCALLEEASEDDCAQLHTEVAGEQQESDPSRPPLGAHIVDMSI